MARMMVPLLLLAALPSAALGHGMAAQFNKLSGMAQEVLSASHSSAAACTGPSCCEKSRCMNVPGLRCKDSRGSTTCVGQSYFPPKMGTCGCTSGACDEQGVCQAPSPVAGAYTGLYAAHGAAGHPQDVAPEDFTLAFGLLGALGAGLSVGGVAL